MTRYGENKSRIMGVLQNKDESLYPRANETKRQKQHFSSGNGRVKWPWREIH